MENNNTTLTAAQRAALANAREAEAQRRRGAAQTAQMPKAPQRSAQPTVRSAHTTSEYPKTNVRRPAAARPQTRAQKPAEKEDTGEFPSYVRTGKGGYKPPKTQKRRVTKHNRRPLDPKFKAAIAAVSLLLIIWIVLLICGVRYTTFKLSDGGKIKFFGTIKDSVPASGWISSSDGTRGRLKDGRIEYSDGSLYEGVIVNAMRAGKGIMTYSGGDTYEGTFIEDKMNGSFTVHYANGDTYIGAFMNNMRHGYGTLSYQEEDGYDVYEGAFANDMKNGEGKMTFADGNIYEGSFVNDLKEGHGKFTYACGDVFEGTFKSDIRYEGTYKFANGASFVGKFEQNDSNQMLEGTYTYTNGTTASGKFDKETQTFIEQ